MSNTTTTKPKRTRTKKTADEPVAVSEPVPVPEPEPKNEVEVAVENEVQSQYNDNENVEVHCTQIGNNGSHNNSFQPRLKTLETMERIKSKIEFFDATEHKRLLQSILAKYSELNSVCQTNNDNDNDNDGFCCDDHVDFKTKAFKEFERQVTQNQNGIFLNLTTCDDSLWQACVICVEQMEQQKMNLEILDKERQMEMAKIMQTQTQTLKV